VGADGVLVIETCDEADIRMRYHNSDGGESEMCGNGLRSIARLAHTLGAAPEKMTVRTGAGIHSAEILDSTRARVSLTDPANTVAEMELPLGDTCHRAGMLNTGVPHLVLDTCGTADNPSEAWRRWREMTDADVVTLGRALRSHPAVMPAGANVNFIARDPDGRVHMRTYERGVEAETLACGTGATAVALTLAAREGLESPVAIQTRSDHTLVIHFERRAERFTNIWLEGPAVITYEGILAQALLP
jgi:diaminopimelate epimerase